MNVQKSIHFSVEKQESVRKYNRIKIPLIMANKDIISISKLNLTYVQVLNIEEIESQKQLCADKRCNEFFDRKL